MKFKNLIIASFLVIAYMSVSNVVEYFSDPMIKEIRHMTKPERAEYYSNLSYKDHVILDVEYAEYTKLKFQIYSVMFFLTFLLLFFNLKTPAKSIVTFGMFVSFASVIDKCVYNIYEFKATDYIVIVAGIIGSLYVHSKARD